MTRGGAKLDEAATADLFHRYIADFDEQLSQRLSSGFDRVMAEMEQSAVHAELRADSFGKELAQWSSTLASEETSADVSADIGKLIACTREMQGAIATLKESLDNSLKEIQTLRLEVDQAREEALTDGLTGLANHRGFDLALESCLAAVASPAQAPSLLMIDIDHFKNVNDHYGHLFGDKVIRSIAHILKANVKGKDTAARYGGEEFVVLLPETTLGDACRVAEKIRLTIAASRVRRADNRQEIGQITVSLGVAGYCAGESALRFVERGDIALYTAKNQGRNRVSVAAAQANEDAGAEPIPLLSTELVAEPPPGSSRDGRAR